MAVTELGTSVWYAIHQNHHAFPWGRVTNVLYRNIEPGNTDPEDVKLGHTNQAIRARKICWFFWLWAWRMSFCN